MTFKELLQEQKEEKSQLSDEIKKSEQAEKRKEQEKKEGDEDKTDKDIKANELEKKDSEPTSPKKMVPSELEMMAGQEITDNQEIESDEPDEKKNKKIKESFRELFI